MTTPLEVTVLTPSITPDQSGQPIFSFTPSAGTVDIAGIAAYYSFVDPNGDATTFTMLHISNIPPLIIDMTYAAFDAIINPAP